MLVLVRAMGAYFQNQKKLEGGWGEALCIRCKEFQMSTWKSFVVVVVVVTPRRMKNITLFPYKFNCLCWKIALDIALLDVTSTSRLTLRE